MHKMRVLKRVLIFFAVICHLPAASIALNASSRTRPGKDLSELQDTFWHLTQLQGTHSDLSGVVIDIDRYAMTFSAPLYFRSFSFEYKTTTTQLKFYPASAYSDITKSNRSQWQIAEQFEKSLYMIRFYDLHDGRLTFLAEDRHPIMVLQSLRHEGIENRRWRIAQYRGDTGQQTADQGLVDARSTAEITFLNGLIFGSPTCGGWTGGFKVSGKQLTVAADVILAGFCPPEEWSESLAIIKAFKGELSIEESEDQILLRDKDGRARVRLVPFGLPPSGPTK
ncbi:MAG TPA: META domain-containing protein [Candidatus Sulfotelmatobacter sp.]|nr:META domain-containing protein [Candidatus Sulfotelmatobacter sp.]